MLSIGDPWPVEEVIKNIFSTNKTFHSIITVNVVVLCKNNEWRKLCVSFPQTSDFARGPDLIVQSTGKTPVKS